MKVTDFIKNYCAYCDDFDRSTGCHAYSVEECNKRRKDVFGVQLRSM